MVTCGIFGVEKMDLLAFEGRRPTNGFTLRVASISVLFGGKRRGCGVCSALALASPTICFGSNVSFV